MDYTDGQEWLVWTLLQLLYIYGLQCNNLQVAPEASEMCEKVKCVFRSNYTENCK